MTETDPFEVTTIDVRGVPTKVFVGAPVSMRAVWEASVVHGDRTYLVYDDERIDFTTAHHTVAVLADRLVREYGVRQGDRVAIAMRNYPEWAFAAWAAFSVGAVLVPLNAWWTGPELQYGLQHSGSTVLFADDERLERLAPLLADTTIGHVVRVRTRRPLDGAAIVARLGRGDRVAGGSARPSPAVRRHRTRQRRDDHVHLGHHRPTEGRRGDAPELHGVPDEPAVPQRDRRCCGTATDLRCARTRCHRRRC